MKVYTGTGDRGKTSLFSGERVAKANVRIEAYGDVDELNAAIGALVAFLPPQSVAVAETLQGIQADLFDLGAWLATTPGSGATGQLAPFAAERADRLERAMDAMDGELAELKSFILPGGHPAAAMAHVARTVCRRTERHVFRLAETETDDAVPPGALVYLNRLSDYLFVCARYCNHLAGVADIPWQRS
ncbi:MAG: cob(I)yrinic acid a,c-diamide adenosyltransferase [Desulfosarcinaceae bacterium]|nr:cob(I)yrinic acid a,c-diamide adenosyltransferase [Desulfosarcinaceae bacterium]